jgi:FlaA1/EpsC-like NDP-sugar epimerase
LPYTLSSALIRLYILLGYCDIQITITGNQTGEVMYEQLVPQAQTSYIIISIASFPSGEYTLELTSEDGKYLVGAFKR